MKALSRPTHHGKKSVVELGIHNTTAVDLGPANARTTARPPTFKNELTHDSMHTHMHTHTHIPEGCGRVYVQSD